MHILSVCSLGVGCSLMEQKVDQLTKMTAELTSLLNGVEGGSTEGEKADTKKSAESNVED